MSAATAVLWKGGRMRVKQYETMTWKSVTCSVRTSRGTMVWNSTRASQCVSQLRDQVLSTFISRQRHLPSLMTSQVDQVLGSRTVMVVTKCCKDNNVSSWRLGKFAPPPTISKPFNQNFAYVNTKGGLYHCAEFHPDRISLNFMGPTPTRMRLSVSYTHLTLPTIYSV